MSCTKIIFWFISHNIGVSSLVFLQGLIRSKQRKNSLMVRITQRFYFIKNYTCTQFH